MFINRIFRRPLIAALFAAALLTGPAHAEGEQQAIEGLNQTLLDTMRQGSELGFAGRFGKLQEKLTGLFDFQTMARIGLQRHWAKITEADRTAIVDAFTRMSVATFASRFDDFKGEEFTVEGTRPGPAKLVLVSTRVDRPGRDSVNLTYVMRQTEDGPRVIDVLAEGKFSELARQRAEMSSVFNRSGASGLIETLNTKAAELAGE